MTESENCIATEEATTETFEQWALLELMGHRRLYGLVEETEVFGGKMLKISVPGKDPGTWKATQFYGHPAIYCITPTTEKECRDRLYPSYERPPAISHLTSDDDEDPEELF